MDSNKDSDSGSNPFLGLFNASQGESKENGLTEPVERIFGLTVDPRARAAGPTLVLIPGVSDSGTLDTATFEAALFERLLLANPADHLLRPRVTSPPDSHTLETRPLPYLFESYKRLQADASVQSTLLSSVLQNAAVCLYQPALFENQDVHRQVVELFGCEEIETLKEFLTGLTGKLCEEEESGYKGVLSEALGPVLAHLQTDFTSATILSFPTAHFRLLHTMAQHPPLAKVLVEFTSPARPQVPLSYAETLLGSILNISVLPPSPEAPYHYFDQTDFAGIKAVEGNVWTGLEALGESVHVLMEALLRDPDQRPRVLTWLGGCLDSNVPRGKLWASHAPILHLPIGVGFVSDAFSLNLCSLLLRLCRPFIQPTPKSRQRLLKVDPTYPASNETGLKSLVKESCLQPTESGEERPCGVGPFSFVTELFHLTQRALDLGVRVVLERAQALYRDTARLQSLPPDTVTPLLRTHMSKLLSMQCALLEPSSLKLLGEFQVGTCYWLLQVLVDDSSHLPRDTFAPLTERPVLFPLPDPGPPTLRCVPELVVEGVETWLRVGRQYSGRWLEEVDLEDVLTLLVVLMGSKGRARNPHLRARLAQSLESLLPPSDRDSFNREKLFKSHPHADQIVEALLNVFVSIEMTGESVAFEQKFNYRRPMYLLMDHLWTVPLHRDSFRRLSREAENRMEEVEPPLFLRFLNLLINDAIFLLDEALANMATLKTMLNARDAGEWERVGEDERSRNEQHLHQTGIMARFDNILGKETIHTLRYLSGEIESLLCHPTMVDRVASMLNYFLYHLVGPNKNNFKVKYQEEYKFEPGAIVKDICRIYISLGESEEFTRALSRDSRSYSSHLFKYASDVLGRISGGGGLVTELSEVWERVERVRSVLASEEELLCDVPEEFLDPIMSSLMSDPVLLPSSRIVLDRTTIARHLLSDQTDPFNRAPLTMNMVQPDTELKTRIRDWLLEKRRQKDALQTEDAQTDPSAT